MQTQANQSSHQESIGLLASASEREAYEQKTKEGKRKAGQILEQLASLIDLIDPSVKLGKKVNKNKASLLKDLTGQAGASDHYQACVEQVCDDLLETSDKKIDEIKSSRQPQTNIMAVERDRKLRTENALKKP